MLFSVQSDIIEKNLFLRYTLKDTEESYVSAKNGPLTSITNNNLCICFTYRFRSCLKTTNTGAANFVGKLFFNIIQTKCFVLKTEKICTNRSWWGKCLHYEHKKQAHIRDPVPY